MPTTRWIQHGKIVFQRFGTFACFYYFQAQVIQQCVLIAGSRSLTNKSFSFNLPQRLQWSITFRCTTNLPSVEVADERFVEHLDKLLRLRREALRHHNLA